MSNAINGTKEGQVKVQLKYDDKNSIMKVTCSDTGCGIKRDIKSQIFTLFTSFTKDPGIGLGLHISKQILDHFDGQIKFKTKYGKGSHFSFTFPLEKAKTSDNDNNGWETSRFQSPN